MDTEEDQQDSARDSKGTTPARITATERRRRREAEGARLRAQGLSYADIADRLGYRDPSSAHKAVSRALASSYREPTEAARLLALNRLDALRQSLAAIATDTAVSTRGVLGALRLLLDVEKREAALLGLDVPAVPMSPVSPDMLDREIERLSGELEAFNALPPPHHRAGAHSTPWPEPTGFEGSRCADGLSPRDRGGWCEHGPAGSIDA